MKGLLHRFLVQSLGGEQCLNLFVRNLPAFIQRQEYGGMLFLRNARFLQEFRKQRTIVHAYPVRAVGKPHHAQRSNGGSQHFNLGRTIVFADNIHVPLVMFAFPTTRHAFVTEALRDCRPLHGECELPLSLRNHARQRRRHFRTQRKLTPRFVLKPVNLVRDLLAALALQQLQTLHHTSIVGLESETLRSPPPGIENAFPPDHVLGIKVTHSARRIK